MEQLITEIIVLFQFIVFQFKMVAPYWFAGIAAGSAVSTFSGAWLQNAASRLGSRFSAICGAAVLGAASPLCMYGTIPVVAAMGRKGVSQHVLAAFMVSSVMINPNLFIVSFALGTPIAITRLLVSIMAGITAGLLSMLFIKKELMDYHSIPEKIRTACSSPAKKFFVDLDKMIKMTFPYMLFGFALTALVERYVPDAWFAGLFGNNSPWGVLLAAATGVPIYLCGGGTIPLLRAWLNSGMSAGAAIAFMTSGPATKINNLSALKIILKGKAFILYIVYVILYSVIAGLAVQAAFSLFY